MVSDLELLKISEENPIWFQNNFLKIRENYPRKQIAIKDKEIVAVADNGKALLEALKNKNIDDSEVIIERIVPKGDGKIIWKI